jgi:hypothetical protein
MINTSMKKVVIYPGRFQPMLSHHAEVYKQLKAQFPDADVFVGTSDKVEAPKSPFNFKEKQLIAAAHGVPADHVLMAARPYHKDDYAKYFNENDTVIIFAVGEKDLERFPFNNVDPKTELDMTVKGEPRPKYYQKINTLQADPRPMSERGYITLAPTIMTGDEVASASAFRQALSDAPDEESAKAVFQKQFGNYDDKIFKLIYSKVTGANMSEQINIMRKLAGLPVAEAAPVAFNAADANPKTAKFLPAGASSAKMSIANRFPKGADLNDPATKQEQFIQALVRSPEALIAEFSERLDPKDDNSLSVERKLSDIVDYMHSKSVDVRGLPKDMKQFVLDLTVNAVKNMSLTAGDNSPAYSDMDDEDEDEFKRESVDLSDIRKEYGVDEAKDEDEDDDSWIPSEDEFDQEIKHGYKGRTTEGVSSEADQVLAQVGAGDLDAYDVMTRPQGPAQTEAAKVIQDMYDEVAIDHHLHPDDDFEKILDIVTDQLDKDYGVGEGMGDDLDPVIGGPEASMTDKPKVTKPKFGYEEAAKSVSQQQAAGAALAAKRGEIPVSELVGASKDMYDSMSEKELEDFAGTEHKGLPKKVEAVESTANNAVSAALAELRKLAGI